ncbi:MAG: response regulator [Saprospiraceae bacterium]
MKFINLIFHVIVVLFAQVSNCQQYSFKSIEREKNDSLQCEHIIQASEFYKYQSVDTLMMLANLLEEKSYKLKSSHFKEYAYNIKSISLKFTGDFANATTYSQKALEVNKLTKDKVYRAKILLNYADLLCQQKQYELCEAYHKEGLEISKRVKDSSLIAKYYTNIGLQYANQNNFDSAVIYYQLGIAMTEKSKALSSVGATLKLNLSHMYSKMRKPVLCIKYAKEVYEYGIANNDADHISLGANNVALSYLRLKNYKEAIKYAHYSDEAALKYKSPQNRLYSIAIISDIHAEQQNFKEAYDAMLIYLGLKDSLSTALYDKNLTEMTSRYELKEKENVLQQKEIIIQKQAGKQRILIIIFSLFIFFFILFYQFIRKRNELQTKTAEIEAERSKLEAAIERAEVERLHEIETLRGNFFSNISHEFRTPLTLILSPAEQLINGKNKEEHPGFIKIIYRNALKMMDLVNQLLDLAKLESGKETLAVSLGNFSTFCSTIFYMFESLALKKDLSLEILLPEKEIMGFFDREVMEKILINLISNAVKFTPNGGIITLKLNSQGQQNVTLTIGDTGIGIAPERLDDLFEKFLAFSTSEVQKGSGIGLSLVKEWVLLHKGKIKVESEETKGSLFILEFNLSESNYQFHELSKEKTRDDNLHLPSSFNLDEVIVTNEKKNFAQFQLDKKPLLLIAEDHDDVRSFIVTVCKNNYEILESDNGKKALEVALEKIPDLIITDIMMPEMNGITLCNILKTNEKTNHIPVIMLTAKSDQGDKISGLKVGANDYLIKPFDADELLTRLDNLYQQSKTLQAYFKKTFHSFTPIEEKVSNMDTAFLISTRTYIENNMANEKFGVSELAQHLNMSRSQLHRKLSSLMGSTPNELIRNMRLEKAKLLLKQNMASISEIAYSCGFNSPAYFAKCYKDYFGISAGKEV